MRKIIFKVAIAALGYCINFKGTDTKGKIIRISILTAIAGIAWWNKDTLLPIILSEVLDSTELLEDFL